MLIIYIIAVGVVVGYGVSLQKSRLPTALYLSTAASGALVGAVLSLGDSVLYLKYPVLLNEWTIPAIFSIAFALMAVLADRRGTKKIIAPLLVVIAIIAGLLFFDSTPREFDGLFREKLTFVGVEEIGQPIHGFDAFTLKRTFPGFIDEDFAGVQTLEGHYEFTSGSLEYKRDQGNPVTSAEQTVSSGGYATLLTNVSQRLNIEATSEESIEQIVTLLSRDMTVSNDASVNCRAEQRNVSACIEIFKPVCGKVNVQCVTSPCEPVEETFTNSCFACTNSLVESYTEGECLTE